MNDPKPVISPIVALLKSRKTMAALITAILNIVIAFAPGLEAHRADLLTISMILTTLLASVLIGSIAHEDAAGKNAPIINAGTADVSVNTPPAVSSPEMGGATAETYIAPGHTPNHRPPLN